MIKDTRAGGQRGLEGEEAVFTYFQNGEEITEEEYNANIQSYEIPLTNTLDWIQIQAEARPVTD